MARTRDTTTAVHAVDLSVSYPSRRALPPAVDGVTFTISRGEVFGLIGETGSGKSTLAAVIAGVGRQHASNVPPKITGGTLSVLGHRMRGISTRAKDRVAVKVGYLAQDSVRHLNPHLTIAENLAEPIFARDRHFDRDEAGRAVAGVLDTVELAYTVMAKLPYELSGGQLQRVALARALILDPLLLVADEPVRGVDVTVRRLVMNVVRTIQRTREFSALVISSDISAVADVADRVAVLYRGTVVGIGSVDEILAAPEHPYLKGLADAAWRGRDAGKSLGHESAAREV